ncbi:FAD-dependent oxidoreductase, partial [Hymenobacter agri]
MAKPTVAIFGGGVAGMSAAHELAERGFAVAVYERQPE